MKDKVTLLKKQKNTESDIFLTVPYFKKPLWHRLLGHLGGCLYKFLEKSETKSFLADNGLNSQNCEHLEDIASDCTYTVVFKLKITNSQGI